MSQNYHTHTSDNSSSIKKLYHDGSTPQENTENKAKRQKLDFIVNSNLEAQYNQVMSKMRESQIQPHSFSSNPKDSYFNSLAKKRQVINRGRTVRLNENSDFRKRQLFPEQPIDAVKFKDDLLVPGAQGAYCLRDPRFNDFNIVPRPVEQENAPFSLVEDPERGGENQSGAPAGDHSFTNLRQKFYPQNRQEEKSSSSGSVNSRVVQAMPEPGRGPDEGPVQNEVTFQQEMGTEQNLPGEVFIRKSVQNSFLKISDKKNKRKSGYVSIEEDEEDRLIQTPNDFPGQNSLGGRESEESKEEQSPTKSSAKKSTNGPKALTITSHHTIEAPAPIKSLASLSVSRKQSMVMRETSHWDSQHSQHEEQRGASSQNQAAGSSDSPGNHGEDAQMKKSRTKSKSILSGPSYKSDEICSSILLDERNSTFTNRQRAQGHESAKPFPPVSTDQSMLQPPKIPVVPPSPGQSLRESNTFNVHEIGSHLPSSNIPRHTNSGKLSQSSYVNSTSQHKMNIVRTSQSKKDINNLVSKPFQDEDGEQFEEPDDLPQLGRTSSETNRLFERITFGKKQSILDLIKAEKKEKSFNERLIRYFNLKMVDKVLYQLKQKDLSSNDAQEQQASLSSEEQKAIDEQLDAKRLGQFIYYSAGIDKQMSGTYFGENKPFNQEACKAFFRQFKFKKLNIDQCWRMVFYKTGLPKEGQQICRIMNIFQDVYLEQNSDDAAVASWEKDTVWTMSVLVLDLNTNLHNPNVKEMLKYTKETFTDQCLTKFPEIKHAFTRQQIQDTYDRIARIQFENKVSLHERYFKRINELSHSLFQQQFDPETQSNNVLKKKEAKPKKNIEHLFKGEGTTFQKYGRFGEPKMRKVYLNAAETEILWCDPPGKKSDQRPRKMLVKELENVLIGSDHTPVMRRHKIPPVFDNYCLSIIGKERSLDLMLQDAQVIQQWCMKLRQLIEDRVRKSSRLTQSPSSPLQAAVEQEVIAERDACPEFIEYIWRSEVINNLQKYWDPLSKKIKFHQAIRFSDPQLRGLLVQHIIQGGGFFKQLTQEERLKNDSQLHGQQPIIQVEEKKPVAGCSGPLASFMNSGSKSESTFDRVMGLFKPKQPILSLEQLWYEGLPNLARYCVWPILIGNQLQLTSQTFSSVFFQVQRIKARVDKQTFSPVISDMISHNIQISRKFSGATDYNIQNPHSFLVKPRHQMLTKNSVLSSVPSEGQFVEGKDEPFQKIPSLDPPPFNRTDPADKGDKMTTEKEEKDEVGVDVFTEHMLLQFSKIDKKVAKLVEAWEKAGVIGELAQIDAKIFAQVMSDVLCSFLIHRANLNGFQSIIQQSLNEKFRMSGHEFEEQGWLALSTQSLYVTGLDKILAPLVLVHLKAQTNWETASIEKTTSQVFIVFSNLVLSVNAQLSEAIPVHYLRHFIADDLAQIQWRMDFFDKLFQKVLPKLHNQFKGINLKNEFFLHGWMQALFVNVQGYEGLELVLRIWDIYLLHGEPILYCVALVLLKHKLLLLSDAPMETWLRLFQKIKKLQLPGQMQHFFMSDIEEREPDDQGGSSEEGPVWSSPHMNVIMREIIRVYLEFNVHGLFLEHLTQQAIAEQKNEIFTKMYLADD